MPRIKKQTDVLLWWLLRLVPVVIITALAFNGGLSALEEMATDGMSWGLFGTFFVQFLELFGTVSWQVCLLVSAVDWVLTVNVVRVVFSLFDIFASWFLDCFHKNTKKGGDW